MRFLASCFALALLLPAGTAAQVPDTATRTLTVAGTGTVQRRPDRARLLLAVESFAPTAQAAVQANAERMDALVRALRQAGLGADRIRTTTYQLNPEYDYREPPEPRQPGQERLIGYRAMNMVQATIDSVPRVGAIIDAAVAAGANRIAGLNFEIRDADAARRDALREAVAVARAEADVLADALGVRLGPALRVATGADGPRPLVMHDMRMEMAAQAPTPVEPGALAVTAHVTIVYSLLPR